VINIHYSQIPLVSLSIVVESPSLLLTIASKIQLATASSADMVSSQNGRQISCPHQFPNEIKVL
jgi:hypothetical protein